LAALKLKFKEDPAFERRIDRGIQMIQLNAHLLSLRDSAPGTKVKPILDELLAIPLRPSDNTDNDGDEKPQRWKESANDFATNAALSEMGYSTCTTHWTGFSHRSTLSIPPRWKSPSGAHGNVSKEEELHKLQLTQDLATRLEQASMPTIASRFQLHAITTAELLHEAHNRAFDMAEHVALEERYILMLLSCQKYDQMYFDNAVSRLDELAAEVNTSSINDWYNERRKIGSMYAKLQDHESAIHFLRTALLGGYLQQDTAEYDVQICETAQLLYDVYGRAGLLPGLDAIKKRVRDELGKDPTVRLEELCKAIRWCEKKGFAVSQKDLQLSFDLWINDKGRTPLHEAAFDTKMDMEVLQCLMLPELLHLRDESGDTALLSAVDRANHKVVEVLLTVPNLVHVRGTEGSKKQTPLHRLKDKNILNLLIEATKRRVSILSDMEWEPVDVDSLDSFHRTALHLACQQGRVDLVETLVAHNADVNAKSRAERTPLHDACSMFDTNKPKQEAIIQLLVNHGAAWEVKTAGGQDPSSLLRQRGFKYVAIRRLSAGDAEVGVRRSLDSNASSSTPTRRTNSEALTVATPRSAPGRLQLSPDLSNSVFAEDWRWSRWFSRQDLNESNKNRSAD
ncbi:ankyrin repeat-containing domain protein, partial [Dactylonectria estremocensis]